MPAHHYEWSTEDLQELDTIIADMKQDGITVNPNTLTSFIKLCYPGFYSAYEYPAGAFYDGFYQWQRWQQRTQPA